MPFSTDFASTMLTSEVTNAWSVSGDTLNSADLASSLFAASLFPYLAFLWYLARPETQTPKGVNLGFRFLLVFVFLTIPAGIYAKVQYSDILANIDWLHGGAESMLTLTNFLIIYGFRATRPRPTAANESTTSLTDNVWVQATVAASAALVILSFVVNSHPEPGNALSIPTWMVHTSSLLEWLYAMKLAWEHAEVSGNPRWKNLTWAMIPSHTSGICACTYHLFYNAKVLTWIVNLQAGLTCTGNAALALAAYRIYAYGKERATTGTAGTAAMIDASVIPLSTSLSSSSSIDTSIDAAAAGANESSSSSLARELEESDREFNTDMFLKVALSTKILTYPLLSITHTSAQSITNSPSQSFTHTSQSITHPNVVVVSRGDGEIR